MFGLVQHLAVGGGHDAEIARLLVGAHVRQEVFNLVPPCRKIIVL